MDELSALYLVILPAVMAAAVQAIRALREQGFGVRALQDYYAGIAAERV